MRGSADRYNNFRWLLQGKGKEPGQLPESSWRPETGDLKSSPVGATGAEPGHVLLPTEDLGWYHFIFSPVQLSYHTGVMLMSSVCRVTEILQQWYLLFVPVLHSIASAVASLGTNGRPSGVASPRYFGSAHRWLRDQSGRSRMPLYRDYPPHKPSRAVRKRLLSEASIFKRQPTFCRDWSFAAWDEYSDGDVCLALPSAFEAGVAEKEGGYCKSWTRSRSICQA